MRGGDSVLRAGSAHADDFLGPKIGGHEREPADPCGNGTAGEKKIRARFHWALEGHAKAQHEREIQGQDQPVDSGHPERLLPCARSAISNGDALLEKIGAYEVRSVHERRSCRKYLSSGACAVRCSRDVGSLSTRKFFDLTKAVVASYVRGCPKIRFYQFYWRNDSCFQDSTMPYKLIVNGRPATVDAPADMPLLWVIRDVLNLRGTKYGCGIGQCGACTVHIGGRAVRSCQTPIAAASDAHITTVEGLSHDGSHPAQLPWAA